MRRLLTLAAIVLTAAAAYLAFTGKDWKDPMEWKRLVFGRAAADPSLIAISGYIEAHEHRLACKASGYLDRVLFEEGDRVRPGQPLAQVDTVDTRLALDGARAERAQADADLKLRQAGFRAEEIAQAEAETKRADSDLQGAEKDLRRMSELLASGSGTTKARDDALVKRDVAAWTLKGLRDNLRKLRSGSRPEEIEASRARLAAADARIAQLEQQFRDATVASPIVGVVTEKLAEQGELASRGTAIAVVTDIDRPWLNVYVGEPDLDRIRLGQEATVVTDGGRERAGRVSFIASQAEFTPKNVQTFDERVKLVYKVKIALDNPDGLFKPGMPAEARIRPVPARPSAALSLESGVWSLEKLPESSHATTTFELSRTGGRP